MDDLKLVYDAPNLDEVVRKSGNQFLTAQSTFDVNSERAAFLAYQ